MFLKYSIKKAHEPLEELFNIQASDEADTAQAIQVRLRLQLHLQLQPYMYVVSLLKQRQQNICRYVLI